MTTYDRDQLEHFFGSYFHQDWRDDHESADAVMRFYFGDGVTAPELAGALRAIRELADGPSDEDKLHSLLREFGCDFYPAGVRLSTRDWLRHLAEMFDEEIARRRGSDEVKSTPRQ